MAFIDFAASTIYRPVRGTPSQRAGLYYEAAVLRWFTQLFSLCAPQPVLHVGRRILRPDLLLFSEGARECVIVEVKNTFTWSALRQGEMYGRAVGLAFPWIRTSVLLVTRHSPDSLSGIRLVTKEEFFDLSQNECNLFTLSKRELSVSGAAGGSDSGGIVPQGSFREPGSARDCLRRCSGGVRMVLL